MPPYTVKEVLNVIEKPDTGYGLKKSVNMRVQETGKADAPEQVVEWYTNRESPNPAPGATVEGEVGPGKYGGLVFKKARGGGFGGGRQKSAEELAADAARQRMIVRQHSQTTAMRWAEFAHLRGTLPENFTIKDLAAVIDHFYNDAMGVAERTSPKA